MLSATVFSEASTGKRFGYTSDIGADRCSITADTIFSELETCRSVSSLDGRQISTRQRVEAGKLDILVRTSNVKRMSDFMLWQVSVQMPHGALAEGRKASEDTQIHFVKTYWPEFGLSDMLPILLGWQQKVWMKRLSL